MMPLFLDDFFVKMHSETSRDSAKLDGHNAIDYSKNGVLRP
jgi:hypothetical protein